MAAFAYFGGIAPEVVGDNLKAGVTRACLHDPAVNRTYGEIAAHYGTAIEHMPSAHPRYPDWTHDRIRHEAATTGDHTACGGAVS